MKFSSLAITLLLCDASLALVAPSMTHRRHTKISVLLKGACSSDDLYQLLAAQPEISKKKNPVSVEKVVIENEEQETDTPKVPEAKKIDSVVDTSQRHDVSDVSKEKIVVKMPEPISDPKDAKPATPPSTPAKPQPVRRRFVPLQESTFSSTSRPQTAPQKAPTPKSSETIMMKPRIMASTGDQTSQPTQKKSLFVVSDEMGRPIHPEPTPAPKGLFEVRDEMGNIIPTVPKPRPKSKVAIGAQLMPNPLVPSEAAAAQSGSKSSSTTTSQGLFTVSGELSSGAASQEMLTLSGNSNKRLRLWTDANDSSSCIESYETEQEPIKVVTEEPAADAFIESQLLEAASATSDQLPVVPSGDTSIPSNDDIAVPTSVTEQTEAFLISEDVPVSPPVATTTATPEPETPRRISQEDLFVVTDEMGRRLNAPPEPKPTGPFEVRDEMGRIINTGAKKATSTSTPATSGMAVPTQGLSKFTATQQLFKVSGESGFASPNEIIEL